jgi:hypothetical protein
MYVSLLGISVALYLSVFEQPASKVFFSTLLALAAPTNDLGFLDEYIILRLLLETLVWGGHRWQ